MIGAEELYADFSIFSLLPPGDPALDHIRIEKARVHLINHSGDSSLNINQWISALSQAFGSTSTEKATAPFFIKEIELRQTTFAYTNLQADPITEGWDYSRMEWNELTANASDFKLLGSNLDLQLVNLSGKERFTGLQINQLKTQLHYSPEALELKDLDLQPTKAESKTTCVWSPRDPKAMEILSIKSSLPPPSTKPWLTCLTFADLHLPYPQSKMF
jgi:hypothetical protein